MWKCINGIYTRHVRVQLPTGVSSLPYAIRLIDLVGKASFYQVNHNGQMKVCNRCMAVDHLYSSCPKRKCRKCGEIGHIARDWIYANKQLTNIEKETLPEFTDTPIASEIEVELPALITKVPIIS